MTDPGEPSAATAGATDSTPALDQRVLGIIRGLVEELGGDRARRVRPDASLERDLGLGSLERVELLIRLEAAFGGTLDDRLLGIDTPEALIHALRGAVTTPGAVPVAETPPRGPIAPARSSRDFTTLCEALWWRGTQEPERPHVYLRIDDASEQPLSYGELLRATRAVAGALHERGVRHSDTVALLLPTGREFLVAFQALLLLGAVPVPVYPPTRLDRIDEYAAHQAAILADAGVVALLTFPRAQALAIPLRQRVATLSAVFTVAELEAVGASWPEAVARPRDAALIQYTSGSTGHPKGVLLTHDNLLANIRAIASGVKLSPTDVGASWLPLYHDMGLIGSWLFCLVHGIPITLLPPLSFLARPERWLRAIHDHRATLSAAPNFAYELCVRKIPEDALKGLDLSSWRCALNGAEPVSPATIERFSRRFSRHGFQPEALMPVYGLAECSVGLCFPEVGRAPRIDRVARGRFEKDGRAETARKDDPSALAFVAVGTPLPEHEVRIVDETHHDVPERTIGRLVFRGPSATPGYYRQPEATAAITLPGGYLDSGDLAYRIGDEIVIAGRAKDLIIKAGRNLVPQEVEDVAASVNGVRKGSVVAFGVDHKTLGTESLVVVAETRIQDPHQRDRIAEAITDRVAAAIGLPPDTVQLVPPGAVPKTSSGKLRRAATRERYLAGELGPSPRRLGRNAFRMVASAVWLPLRARLMSLGQWIRWAGLFVVLAPTALLAGVLALLLPKGRPLVILERLAARVALRLAGCHLTVEGLENLSGPGPFLLASNHASYVDIPALLAPLPIDFLFVAKREVLRWPFIGRMVRRRGHLTVDRFDSQQSVADAELVKQALVAGSNILIFPEGTFQEEIGLRPFRLGAFKTAVETGVKVVPLALRGTRRILRGDSLNLHPGPIELRVGQPIAADGDDFRAVVRLRDAVAEAIAAHCGEPVLGAQVTPLRPPA